MPEIFAQPKQTVKLNIEGMTCSNCALGITKYLEKKGLENILVDFSTAEARFKTAHPEELSEIKRGIENLGYHVVDKAEEKTAQRFQITLAHKFYACLALSMPLLLHMFIKDGLLANPYFQLALCVPVFAIGIRHFGKSAVGSLLNAIPNMDVLVLMGSSAAFFYSLYGTIANLGHDFMFYETAATIITVVLLGNLLEQKSVQQTTTAIRELGRLRVQKAKLVTGNNGTVNVQEVDADSIRKGQMVLVNTGDRIPADGIIEWGECSVDESMITGESVPSDKNVGDKVIGGTVLLKGSIKVMVEATGSDSFLARIIDLVKEAQQTKPDIQRIADKVSAWFVPAVLLIALLTFVISAFVIVIPVQSALMHSIAVLVIACPCAMGLATPTAVMVGIGLITKKGILIKGGKTLETLSTIKQVVFDKTGTLTTGRFKIKKITTIRTPLEEIKTILFSLEKHSSHPIAQSIIRELKDAEEMALHKIREMKGSGMQAEGKDGVRYELGSYDIARSHTTDNKHDIYIFKNKKLIGYVDIEDELKPEAKAAVDYLKANGIIPILLSGDSYRKCGAVASKLEIEKIYFNKQPHEKLEIITNLSKVAPTAMVGDGINDAPALAKADIGISLSDATEVAIDSSQVILLNGNLAHLKDALEMSKKTMTTIRQNLFWAFFYNILAIPVAAVGFLSPMIAAFSMALSDVFVVGNSLRLRAGRN